MDKLRKETAAFQEQDVKLREELDAQRNRVAQLENELGELQARNKELEGKNEGWENIDAKELSPFQTNWPKWKRTTRIG